MRERAERIGADLKVWSGGVAAGTEVELCVPSHIAFQHLIAQSVGWPESIHEETAQAIQKCEELNE
jgi:hypothetical protein